jgi:hypothetical protein
MTRILTFATFIRVSLPLSIAFIATCGTDRAVASGATQIPSSVEVTIAEGIKRVVQFVSDPTGTLIDRTRTVVSQLPTFRDAARSGDGSAAFALYESLETCRAAPRTHVAFDSAVALLRTERKISLPNIVKPVVLAPSESAENIEQIFLVEPFRMCAGVSDADLMESRYWLNEGVRLGNDSAALHSLEFANSDQERLDLWNIAWRSGHCAALAGIADVLWKRSRTDAIQPDDLANAYAHQLLFVRLQEQARLTALGRIRGRTLAAAKEQLLLFERDLTTDEVFRSRQQAVTILATNGSRCYPM